MLSYGLSMLVVILLLLFGTMYLLRRYFPSIHKTIMGVLKLVRRVFRGLIKRLGWSRSLLLIYLFVAVILTLAVLSNFGRNPLENIGVLSLVWFPVVAVWKIRKYFKERRERRYRLPGRRR